MARLLERLARSLRRHTGRPTHKPATESVLAGPTAHELAFLRHPQSRSHHQLLVGHHLPEGSPLLLEPRHREGHLYCCGITGSGKSRFLQHVLCSDLTQGRPVWVLDPFGGLYRSALQFLAAGIESAGEQGFPVDALAERYFFVDLSDAHNPLQVNPLDANPLETVEQQVDDLMRTLERLLERSLEDQRRLRNILRGVLTLAAELNRLPEKDRPAVAGLREGRPLDLFFAADVINMGERQRKALLAALPHEPRLRFRRQYFDFFHALTAHERSQIVQSSWNVLQFVLDDRIVSRFFGPRTTLDLPAALRDGKSVIAFLPAGENLASTRLVGKYIATKLHHGAFRRTEQERQQSISLFMDEFHFWMDQAMAEGLTSLRQFGVSVACAHQSTSQPPFNTEQGQGLLRTVQGNSRLKALFRLGRADAEYLTKDLFVLSQQKPNYETVDRTVGHSEQHGRTVGSGTTWSSGSTQKQSTSQSRSLFTSREGSTNQMSGSGSSTQHGGREERSESTTRGTSESQTTKTVYYSLAGERELLVNSLQSLPTRQFYFSFEPLRGHLLEAPFVPDELYAYQLRDFPRELLEWQRERYAVELASEQALPVGPLGEEQESQVVPLSSKPLSKTKPQATVPKSKPAQSQSQKMKSPPVRRPAEDEDDPFLD